MTTADPSPPRVRRRWYQFSLRTLLIFVTIVGCGLGWFGIKVQQAIKQKAAVDVILKSGGMVAYDYQLDESGTIWQDKEPSGPPWLRSLLKADLFANVIYADVETNEELTLLQDLPQLNWLFVGRNVTDVGWEHLRQLGQLKRLVFARSQISDDSLKNLRELSQLTTLKFLDIPITDAGLIHVNTLSRLQSLDLSYTAVTDAGLVQFTGLGQLENLSLQGTQITDAGLEHLLGMNKLCQLDLRYTKVTDEGIRKVRESLPNCIIIRE